MAHDCTAKPTVMFPTSYIEVFGTCWTQLNISVINPGHNCLLIGCQKRNQMLDISKYKMCHFCCQDNGAGFSVFSCKPLEQVHMKQMKASYIPFLLTGSDGKSTSSLLSLIKSLLVSAAYRSKRLFLRARNNEV
jgi:hypothetical protein